MHDLISRQAAIDAHYEYCNKHPDAGFPVWSLKILEDLPSAQPDLSGYSDRLWKAAYERGKAEALAERKTGRWIIEPGIGCKCSECDFDIGNDLDFMEYVNFCPNCGADMRGGQDE